MITGPKKNVLAELAEDQLSVVSGGYLNKIDLISLSWSQESSPMSPCSPWHPSAAWTIPHMYAP